MKGKSFCQFFWIKIYFYYYLLIRGNMWYKTLRLMVHSNFGAQQESPRDLFHNHIIRFNLGLNSALMLEHVNIMLCLVRGMRWYWYGWYRHKVPHRPYKSPLQLRWAEDRSASDRIMFSLYLHPFYSKLSLDLDKNTDFFYCCKWNGIGPVLERKQT